MSQGYWIIVFDGWGEGLNMINPRMLEQDGTNWFTYVGDFPTYEKLCERHGIDEHDYVKIVR